MIKQGYIYKITNPIGQKYIGLTTRGEARWSDYHGKSKSTCNQKKLWASFITYGINNHKFEFIYKTKCTLEELKNFEIFFIKFFNSFYYENRCKGLNMTRGGGIIKTFTTEETKEKQRQARKRLKESGWVSPKKGIQRSKEVIEKIKNSNTGKKRGEEFRAAVSQRMKIQSGINPVMPKGGKHKIETIEKLKNSSNEFSVIKLSKEGQFIEKYRSVKDAARNVSGDGSNIALCCRKSRRTCKGYKWVYASEYYKQEENIQSPR